MPSCRRRFLGFASVALTLGLVGCVANESSRLPLSRGAAPLVELPERTEERVVRAQRAEIGLLTVPDKATANVPGETVKIRVCAWVNGKPIYDDDVMLAMRDQGRKVGTIPVSEQPAFLTKLFNEELNNLVEREMIYQDAMTKLQKNPRMLDKVKQLAAKTADDHITSYIKQVKKLGTDEQIQALLSRQQLDAIRRQDEYNFVVGEYVRSNIFRQMMIGQQEIREWYDTHASEFRTVDKVKWQNIFIAVGPKYATQADARRFADQILAQVRSGHDFANFLQYDEGDSWQYRKGDGMGSLRGQIKPQELENHLFNMRDGQVGPPVEIGTGVHLFRLVKRDYAGQMPFDDKVQSQIAGELKKQIAEREYKRMVKDLRERSVVELVRPGQ